MNHTANAGIQICQELVPVGVIARCAKSQNHLIRFFVYIPINAPGFLVARVIYPVASEL